MERNIRLNWPELVNEAVKRRKQQKLTQKQLAILVGVSGPTVNSFEQGKTSLTLESCFKILRFLGLLKDIPTIICEWAKEHSFIRKAYYFGSAFKGEENPKDIDVAIEISSFPEGEADRTHWVMDHKRELFDSLQALLPLKLHLEILEGNKSPNLKKYLEVSLVVYKK